MRVDFVLCDVQRLWPFLQGLLVSRSTQQVRHQNAAPVDVQGIFFHGSPHLRRGFFKAAEGL